MSKERTVIEFDLVFGVIDDGALGTSVEGCLRFQPTREAALTHRVENGTRPHHVRLACEGCEVKRRSNGDQGGGSIGVCFHGSEQRFCSLTGGRCVGLEVDTDHGLVHVLTMATCI